MGIVIPAFIGLSSYVVYNIPRSLTSKNLPREGRTRHGDYMYDLDRDGLVDIIRREGDMRYLTVAKGYEERAAWIYLRTPSFHIMTPEERDISSTIMLYQLKLDLYPSP